MEISASGQEALNAATDYCGLLEAYWGESDNTTLHARKSLLNSIAQMMRLGGRWWKDGEMALVGSTPSGLVVGVIPHMVKPRCMKCDYWHGKSGVFTYKPTAEALRCEGEHEWSLPPNAPAPVVWSTHS